MVEPWITGEDVQRERLALDPNGTHRDSTDFDLYAKAACEWVETQCGTVDHPRTFVLTVWTDVVLDGRGGRRQRLPNGPIVSLESVILDGGVCTVGTQRQMALGEVEMSFSASRLISNIDITRGESNLLVSYTSGFERASIPQDLRTLAAWLGAYMFTGRGGDRIGKKESGRMNDREVFDHEIPAIHRMTLEKYRVDVGR